MSAKEYTQKMASSQERTVKAEFRAKSSTVAGGRKLSFNGPNTCRERPMEFFRKGPAVAATELKTARCRRGQRKPSKTGVS